MNNSYPSRHFLHSYQPVIAALPPLCSYCLHLLGTAPVSANKRRELQEQHACVEKFSVREPAVSLPFN